MRKTSPELKFLVDRRKREANCRERFLQTRSKMAPINDPINAAFSFFFPRKWHPRQLSRQTQSPNFVTNRLGDQKGHSLKRWLFQVWSFFQHISSCMFPLFNIIITRKALLVERGEISYCCQSVEISLFFNPCCFFLQDLAICVNSLKTVNIQFLPQESCISWDVKDRAARIPQNTSASFITESSWRMQPWELVRSLSFEKKFLSHYTYHNSLF